MQTRVAKGHGLWIRILILGGVCLLLQQVEIPYSLRLMGSVESSASLIHLHLGAMLLIAMLVPDRRVLAGVVMMVTVGWLVRALVMGYEPPVLFSGVLAATLRFGWTLLCAHWMGWPRLPQRIGRNELGRLVAIGLLLFPAGAALIGTLSVLAFASLPQQLNITLQSMLAKQFGVATCLPLLVAWSEWREPPPGHSKVRWLVPLLLGAGLLASVLANRQAQDVLADAGFGVVLMDYRFTLCAVLAWCVLRLRPRTSMFLLATTVFVLVAAVAGTAEQVGHPMGLVNLLHIVLELNFLLVAMLYVLLSSRDARRLTRRLDDESRRDAITRLPNVKALREHVARQSVPQVRLGYLLLDHTEDLTPGFGLHINALVMTRFAAVVDDLAWTFLVASGQFALLSKEADDTRFWSRLMERIQQSEIDVDRERFRLLPYIGVATLRAGDAKAVDAGLLLASQRAFEARRCGELQPLHESSVEDVPHRQQIDAAGFALDCLRSGRIELYFQPIRRPLEFTVAPDAPLVGEILCRLRDDRGELVTPDRFIKPIEAVGRGVELDLTVLQTLFTLLRDHPQAIRPGSRLSVNLTGQSLASASFQTQLLRLLDDAPLPLSALCLEITETTAIASPFSARGLLDELRRRGCRIAIDDFGTGMQSFARLKEMPVDIIKIDGSFIVNAAQRGRDYALVQACVAVARAFEAETVAEFVENLETAELLRELGVDWMQGYLYSRPLPLRDMLAIQRPMLAG